MNIERPQPAHAAQTPLNGSSQDHALAMDRMYGWQRSIYDLTRRYYLLGRDRLIAQLNPPDGGVVLEVGCGTARNLVAIGRRYPQARLIGLDISDVMLAEAAKAMRRAGFGYRTRLVKADASQFDARKLFHPTPIDRVVMSYTLSMIPNWRGAVQTALSMLPDDGELHIVDFGMMEGLPGFIRAALRRWLKGFSVTPREELIRFLKTEASSYGMSVTETQIFGGYAVLLKAFKPAA